jgi:F-type H+-transporting ATPase subunit delta
MKINNLKNAKNFASAFLNLYINSISEKDLLNLISLSSYLKQNNKLINYVCKISITTNGSCNFFKLLLKKFDLPIVFQKLVDLLANRKLLYLINDIFSQIILLYQKRNKVMLFNIKSVIPLEENDLYKLKIFLEKTTNNKIIETLEIDKSLIAGIKAQSNNFLFENSISKKLKTLRQL